MTVVFPPETDSVFITREFALTAVAIYTVICGITSYRSAQPVFDRMRAWLAEGRPPTPEERRAVMRLPVFFARMTFVRWAIAVPVFALALDPSAPPEARSLGIGPRLLLTWVLCSGVPIVMVALIPVGREVSDPSDLIAPIWFASAAALGAGFIATKLATQTVASPVRELRHAIDAVTQGDLDVSVPVDDGSEVGRLQAGFNGMVAGLREREQLRDLYGRHVGADVAREALERGTALGGATCEVSALFVDVVGSTELARAHSPERVVAMLNEFFEAVVVSVHEHEGLVNKFEGDAALCVFGEYTVIGNPVNEAARLTELAKQHDERLLASGDTVDRAGGEEAARWCAAGEVVLRGRECPTRIAVPVSPRGGRTLAPAGRAARAPGLPAR